MVYTGKFASCIVYSLIYLYASEMMPTSIRTYAIGIASMVGRIGSASAPIIVDVLVSIAIFIVTNETFNISHQH